MLTSLKKASLSISLKVTYVQVFYCCFVVDVVVLCLFSVTTTLFAFLFHAGFLKQKRQRISVHFRVCHNRHSRRSRSQEGRM